MKTKSIVGVFVSLAAFSVIFVMVYAQGASVVFTETLQLGSSSTQVSALQEYFRKFPDIYPEGFVTGYFGTLTESAVKLFQKREGIAIVGIVGPVTRARLNELAAGASAAPIVAFPSTGAVGETGAVGAVGATGTIGATGATGTIGATGRTGERGTVGSLGATGAAGSAGSTGATGSAGATGATGAAGSAGSTGATGSAGATGATGAAGAAGTIIPAGIELGTLDAFSRYQIWNNMLSPILRIGSWQADGDATSNVSEGIVVYGNSLTGLTLAAGNGSYARMKSDRFGLFTIDSSTAGFSGSGGYYYRVDPSALFYKNDAAADVFRVTRATGDMSVKGAVTLSNFTQAGIVGTNVSGLLSSISGTTGQVPVWNNSANGFSWAAAPAGAMPSAQYAQLGSQPATIAPGNPFSYTTTVLSTAGITANTTASPGGTIFTLANLMLADMKLIIR